MGVVDALIDVLQSTQVLRAVAVAELAVDVWDKTQTIGIPQGAKPQGASKKRKYSQTPFTIQKALMPGI